MEFWLEDATPEEEKNFLIQFGHEDGAMTCKLGPKVERVILDTATGSVRVEGEMMAFGPRLIISEWHGEIKLSTDEGEEFSARLAPMYLDAADRQGIPVVVLW
jgi:hypothetical protein